jgi:hypothetical protein
MEKDATIAELLSWLGQRLGNKLVVTDLGMPISVLSEYRLPTIPRNWFTSRVGGGQRGTMELSLNPPLPGSDATYQTVGNFQAVTRETLLHRGPPANLKLAHYRPGRPQSKNSKNLRCQTIAKTSER